MARLLIGVLLLCFSSCSANPGSTVYPSNRALQGSRPEQDGSANQGSSAAERIVAQALAAIAPFHPVELDTETIARAVRAGQTVRLPFVDTENRLTGATVQLTLRELRNPTLVDAFVKNGVSNSFRPLRLPPPATYQGRVDGRPVDLRPGAAVFTVNERVVEGNILLPTGGWSIIEPLEPLLRLRGVGAQQREVVLRAFNHIVYNPKVPVQRQRRVVVDADLFPASRPAKREPVEVTPLVASAVGDGDDGFYRAYPPDSIMPFWLKQEALFNVLDWLLNCVEPEANADNAYARCDNEFDGGTDGFQVRVRLDRLEAWEAGGPSSENREELLRQSARETHQATPPCCGEPHTAGRSSFVFFFSGRTLEGGAGVASLRGLGVYCDSCFAEEGADYLCHHALSQMTPSESFPGNVFFQELLVAHEVGHLIGGGEQPLPFSVCWLFGEQCGPNLMGSLRFGQGPEGPIYLFTEDDTHRDMGPLLLERLGPATRGKPAGRR